MDRQFWRLYLQVQVALTAWMRMAAASRFACRCRWKIPRTSAFAQGIQEELGFEASRDEQMTILCSLLQCHTLHSPKRLCQGSPTAPRLNPRGRLVPHTQPVATVDVATNDLRTGSDGHPFW